MSAELAALVLGCEGTALTAVERDFFRDTNPLGFILFRRNVDSPDQVRALVDSLRDAVGRHAPILIDQEGGRVARLRGPHWPELPAARAVGDLADAEKAGQAAWLHGRLLAAMLSDLSIDVDCAPVADVPVPGAHDVIGDRAFAMDPVRVAALAASQAAGLLAGGVLPIVKHIPGHGRAFADSHKELPVVSTPRAELEAWDFAPFKALSHLPAAMVAHVVYTDIDADRPSSISPTVIRDIVRGHIGFDGLLFSDDLSMQALSGTLGQRTAAVLAAGCDVALHCNGQMAEMLDVAANARALDAAGMRRWSAASALVAAAPPTDINALRAEFDRLLVG
ncbi:beta-N-acetylhexosaminidase [Niveispirillum cyanobacteriorum]|uniref:beta-N-acetylhexosaminidase n=1 Tax=Niveispirillum cyanobacteriorum TaxID=1612173 RepID=UPI0019B56057|nr:beta-N-acetylhexosaminidase [Niveispirillum cyanobacteriorum]GGE62824.1 beta-hexosaminidase [Niveispirillum cyanobacteriorum]